MPICQKIAAPGAKLCPLQMNVVATQRLTFRQIRQTDAGFIHELYGTDSFKRFSGNEGLGCGLESSRRFVAVARDELHLPRIAAIASSDNYPCLSLLAKLDFEFVKVHEALLKEVTLGLYMPSFDDRN